MKAGDLRVIIKNPNGMPIGGIIRILATDYENYASHDVRYEYATGEFLSRFTRPSETLERDTRPASKLHRYLYGL